MSRILLVEDNDMNRDMLSRRLARCGFEILLAVDGSQAVAMARRERPDLILLDMSLPVMDGWDAARFVRDDPDTRNIPIVALTAHAMVGDRQKAIDAGCDEYESKPVEFDRLLGKIRRYLSPPEEHAGA